MSLGSKEKDECLHYGLCKSVIAGVNHDPDCPLFRDYSHAELTDDL